MIGMTSIAVDDGWGARQPCNGVDRWHRLGDQLSNALSDLSPPIGDSWRWLLACSVGDGRPGLEWRADATDDPRSAAEVMMDLALSGEAGHTHLDQVRKHFTSASIWAYNCGYSSDALRLNVAAVVLSQVVEESRP